MVSKHGGCTDSCVGSRYGRYRCDGTLVNVCVWLSGVALTLSSSGGYVIFMGFLKFAAVNENM